MSLWTFIFATIAVTMTFVAYIEWTKLKRRELDRGDARQIDAVRTENDELRQQVGELTERLKVLERIATDPAERVSREIEELR
jgi:cell division protein FtsL